MAPGRQILAKLVETVERRKSAQLEVTNLESLMISSNPSQEHSPPRKFSMCESSIKPKLSIPNLDQNVQSPSKKSTQPQMLPIISVADYSNEDMTPKIEIQPQANKKSKHKKTSCFLFRCFN